jgi:hypothetical protein
MSVKLIDWSKEIAPDLGAKVLFSVLALTPHKEKIDGDIAAIELPGSVFIDVEFVASKDVYLVRLFKDDPDSPIGAYLCYDAASVISAVKEFSELTRVRPVSKRIDDTTYIELKDSIGRNTSRAASGSHTKIIKRPLEIA